MSKMEATEFRAARVRAGLSVRRAAEALGVAPSTIERWQTGGARIPADAADRIRALAGETLLEPLVASALGRLYAVLEHVVTSGGGSMPGNMPTLLFGATAAGVATLLRLGREGHAVAYHVAEEDIMAIMADIPDFPARLTNSAQGHFWLAYYARKGGKGETDDNTGANAHDESR